MDDDERPTRGLTYGCGGPASYAGPCGCPDCVDCYPAHRGRWPCDGCGRWMRPGDECPECRVEDDGCD